MAERKPATIVEVEPSGLTWRKSSASSGSDNQCVEYARSTVSVLVRNSRDRRGARLVVTGAAWRLLVQASPRL